MPESVTQIVRGLFDYAGLYPPASLDLARSCSAYARHVGGVHADALGRFIIGAAKLEEFSRAAAAMMPGTFATSGYMEHLGSGEPWRVSAIVRPGDVEADVDAVGAFNAKHDSESAGLARCDTLEIRVPSEGDPDAARAGATGAAFIDAVQEDLPDDLFTFFEIPTSGDPRGLIAAIAGTGSGAKLRTGGVTPDAYPSAEDIAKTIHACAAAEVPFKCTAGLHHPFRGERALTYDDGAPRGVQFGFLPITLAAALVRDRAIDAAQTAALLASDGADAFEFADEGAAWNHGGERFSVGTTDLINTRRDFFMAIGSCSFDEPIDDLRDLGLLAGATGANA